MKKLKEIALYTGVIVAAILSVAALWVIIIPALAFIGAITLLWLSMKVKRKI